MANAGRHNDRCRFAEWAFLRRFRRPPRPGCRLVCRQRLAEPPPDRFRPGRIVVLAFDPGPPGSNFIVNIFFSNISNVVGVNIF
jgi:hypothetical protein